MRPFMEAVHNPDADIPDSLKHSTIREEGNERASASLARMNKIAIGSGYKNSGENWWGEAYTPTRLGEEMTTLHLAKWENGQLRPWIDAGEERHSWRLSGVSVRSWHAAEEGAHPDIPQNIFDFRKKELPAEGRWGILLPLTLCDGRWVGTVQNEQKRTTNFSYSEKDGLLAEE